MGHKVCDLFTPVWVPWSSLWTDALQIPQPYQGRVPGANVWACLPHQKHHPTSSSLPQAFHLLASLPVSLPSFCAFSVLASFLNSERWIVMQISLSLKTLAREAVSPIFMSSKWLLSKWGHTKSHSSCHKYKWLGIGGNKPSREIMRRAVAAMVYHTGSIYFRWQGNLILQGTLISKNRKPSPGEPQNDAPMLI